MDSFRILLVEDNRIYAENMRQNLLTVTVQELTGKKYDNDVPIVDHVGVAENHRSDVRLHARLQRLCIRTVRKEQGRRPKWSVCG